MTRSPGKASGARSEPQPEPAAEPEPEPEAEQEPPARALDLPDYEELEAEEIIALLGSMDRDDLEALRELEAHSRSREPVLHAIDSVLARAPAAT
jgi:hypothetical protein